MLSVNKSPDRLILQCGTNDLSMAKSKLEITKEIASLAKNIQDEGSIVDKS